jgi:hypothetical protein
MREKRWLDDLETSVRDTFWTGKALTSQQVDEIMVRQIRAEKAQTKGFVLDMDFSKAVERIWAQRFQESGMLEANEITHIVELHLEDDEVKLRAEHLRSTPANGLVYSRWERAEFAKKKPVKYDEDGNPIEEEEEGEEEDDGLPRLGRPLDENLLVARECDARENIMREIDYYSLSERPAFDDLIAKLYDSTYIKVDCSGMTPTELSDVVTYRLKPKVAEPLRPIAVTYEDGAGDFKSLLTEALVPDGVEDDNVLPRQWSLWKTSDPVALYEGRVEPGVPENAAHFANNVFVFANDVNRDKFVKDPRKYLQLPPAMPQDYRLMMLGPRGSGVRAQAARLEQFYGWRVVDFMQVVQDKLREILAMPSKLPNNICPETGPCMVSMSQEELDAIKEGKVMATWKFLPWVLEFLEIPLALRPKPEVKEEEPNEEEMTEQQKKELLKH